MTSPNNSSPKTERKPKTPLVKTLINKNRVVIVPYHKYSRSAQALAEYFHRKITDKIMAGDLGALHKDVFIVNWGKPTTPYEHLYPENPVVNSLVGVNKATRKITTFQSFATWNEQLSGNVGANDELRINFPEYTSSQSVALDWIADGYTVFSRKSVSTGGQDIQIISDVPENACEKRGDFYVKYVPKKEEYRVHVFDGKVVDIQRKALRSGIDKDTVDFRIRNYSGGFVFIREGIDPNDKILQQAVLAVQSLGLVFGAVDVIWNEHYQKAYVLEVNTAPGLEGQTVKTYISSIETYVQS